MRCHALHRAFERFPGVCAPLLVKGLAEAARVRDENVVQFCGVPQSNTCNGLYRFRAASGVTGYAIISEATGFVITLIPSGGHMRLTRGVFFLGNNGLEAPQ